MGYMEFAVLRIVIAMAVPGVKIEGKKLYLSVNREKFDSSLPLSAGFRI
jgi:hypothetical protein